MKGLKLEPHNLTIRRIPCNMQCGVRATTAGVGLPALDRAPIDAVRPVSEVTAAHRVARPHRMDVHQAVSAIAHNGCLRIMPHAAYANAGRVANAADRLRGAASQFVNEFWAAPVRIVDAVRVDHSRKQMATFNRVAHDHMAVRRRTRVVRVFLNQANVERPASAPTSERDET